MNAFHKEANLFLNLGKRFTGLGNSIANKGYKETAKHGFETMKNDFKTMKGVDFAKAHAGKLGLGGAGVVGTAAMLGSGGNNKQMTRPRQY